mgnify:CR=1 FL=1
MTINRKSILVQSSTGSSMNVTTDKVEGDGYYGYSDGTHTLAVAFSAFKGRVSVQGTLSLTPTETDWFSIQIQAGLPVSGTAGYTGVEAYTVVGNFTYLRVVIDRSHLGDGTTYATDYGSINYIRMSA